jgi:hypothetical protein
MRRFIAVHLRPHKDARRAVPEGRERDRAAFKRLSKFLDAQASGRSRRKLRKDLLHVAYADRRRINRRNAETLVVVAIEQCGNLIYVSRKGAKAQSRPNSNHKGTKDTK